MKHLLPLFVIAWLVLSGCRKEIQESQPPADGSSVQSSASTNGLDKKKVYVSTVQMLYEAVNHPDNAGAIIVLEPGTYVLHESYPNAGRLELLENMSLQGQPGHPEDVVIDASLLPTTSFAIGGNNRTGVVQMGRGDNQVEWLKILGNTTAFAAIDADLEGLVTSISVKHTIIRNGIAGISVRNRLVEHIGRRVFAEIEDNDISGMTTGLGTALFLFNGNSTMNCLIDIQLSRNNLYGNRVALRTQNLNNFINGHHNEVVIRSQADRYEGNGTGLVLLGGNAGGAAGTATANDNLMTVEIHGSSIRDNNPSPMPPELLPADLAALGGIVQAGGVSLTANHAASRNKLVLNIWGTVISNNGPTDIQAFGAFASPPLALAGTDNLALVNLHGVSAQAMVVAVNSFPNDPGGTNSVQVNRN